MAALSQRSAASQNEFSALASDDDDDVEVEEKDQGGGDAPMRSPEGEPLPKSPRMTLHRSSSSSSAAAANSSPRWTKITRSTTSSNTSSNKQRNMPLLSLGDADAPSAAAAGMGMVEEFGDGEGISSLASLTVDSKGRRGSHRTQHGNKPNQYKALKQRLHNQARRDVQRQHSKSLHAAASKGAAQQENADDNDVEDDYD